MAAADLLPLLLSVGAGAGFKNVTEGMKKMAESGPDSQALLSAPNMPLFMAGAGLRDMANSMELIGPLMKMLSPQEQPEQPDPNQVGAAMQMLTAQLGPGLSGLTIPPSGPSLGPPIPPVGGPGPVPIGPGVNTPPPVPFF